MSWLLRAVVCVAAAGAGGALAVSGCTSSADVAFTGTEHPAVAVEDVDTFGDQAPPGFAVTGVVTAVCETMNGASGVFESSCTEAELLAMARRKAAASGGHALADVDCRNEQLERSYENVDGGGVKVTTRERLTCRATVVRWTKGPRAPRQPAAGTTSATAQSAGHRVLVGDIPVDVVSTPRGLASGAARPVAEVLELDREPEGFVMLGKLSATCAVSCAPRHARAALREEAARRGASAIAAPVCEVIGAERWQCEAALVGEGITPPATADAGHPPTSGS